MNKLNQEYFKTKKEHEKNVSPKSWLLVIPILFVLLGVMAWATNKTTEIGVNRTKDEIQNIGTSLLESNMTQDQEIVSLSNLGLTVELHKGLKYNYSEQVKMLTAISQDSTQLAYLIGEVPLDMQKSNMKELWIKGVKEKDPNQRFRDSLGKTFIETTQHGIDYKGILIFKEINEKRIVLNSTSTKESFSDLKTKMNEVFESLKAK